MTDDSIKSDTREAAQNNADLAFNVQLAYLRGDVEHALWLLEKQVQAMQVLRSNLEEMSDG